MKLDSNLVLDLLIYNGVIKLALTYLKTKLERNMGKDFVSFIGFGVD